MAEDRDYSTTPFELKGRRNEDARGVQVSHTVLYQVLSTDIGQECQKWVVKSMLQNQICKDSESLHLRSKSPGQFVRASKVPSQIAVNVIS